MPDPPSSSTSGSLTRIAAISALILFLEMLLIRWVGTEVRVFAYLQNAVLVATFLGLGLGCRSARRPIAILPAVLALTVLAVLVLDPLGFGVSEALTRGLTGFADSVVWGNTRSSASGPLMGLSLVMTLMQLSAIAIAFVPLGRWLGRWMDAHPHPIPAYTANILGSLLGIGLFDAATVARTPPWSWLLVVGVGLVVLASHSDERRPRQLAAIVLALVPPMLAWSVSAPAIWSPYQKLTTRTLTRSLPGGREEFCAEEIQVNSAFHQFMVDLDPGRMARLPELYPRAGIRTSHYVVPYELLAGRERVLVLGAGSGNDVAGALRAGVRSVDAVEIDPVIVEWGRERHPNRPYSSTRVRVINDDARAFLRRAEGPYDLVWFGFLDSHTNPSAYTNVRLDHFVYTRESFADVRRILSPSGAVVLFFWAETPWIADRLAGLLEDTLGAPPLRYEVPSASQCLGHGGMMLVGARPATLEVIRRRTLSDPELSPLMRQGVARGRTVPTTDDWPYLYLEKPGIPMYHLIVGAAALMLGLAMRRRLFRPSERVDVPMMLLGAGFMLLEVTGVSRAALLYGTTWTVNGYVVGAILTMILLANLVASRLRINPFGWPFAGLAVSLIVLGWMPTSWMASLDIVPRIIAGGAFLALPVFFSGLIFVTTWAGRERRDLALGSNIIGSLIGGVATLLSMRVGFRALTFLTLLVYVAAVASLRRETGGSKAAPSEPAA